MGKKLQHSIKTNTYFTRLTPNFNNWEKPSGRDGKCRSANAQKPLYEEINGFGWEEWLFEDYRLNKNNPEHTCFGFLEAYNQQNENKSPADRIYLYTKVGANDKCIAPGCYYVGYIDNVQRIDLKSKSESDIITDLKAVDLHHIDFSPMLLFAKNISFKVKDVHVNFNHVFKRPIQLNRGQFRFGLYDVEKHINFLTKIKRYD
jgi:hypothetical protein